MPERHRLQAISSGQAGLGEEYRPHLDSALADGSLQLPTEPGALAETDAVIICVPMPVDRARRGTVWPRHRAVREHSR